jgi:hypothetical protein
MPIDEDTTEWVLFDPTTHTINGGSCAGDHGVEGLVDFVENHTCNTLCRKLDLNMADLQETLNAHRKKLLFGDGEESEAELYQPDKETGRTTQVTSGSESGNESGNESRYHRNRLRRQTREGSEYDSAPPPKSDNETCEERSDRSPRLDKDKSNEQEGLDEEG